ncbi:MAG TPA: hypothetical protein VNY32_03370, partial [Candidatus Acidoferrales bacterium]|nr:hypothetical protein [Candidatus Acidoferrales bacterium]
CALALPLGAKQVVATELEIIRGGDGFPFGRLDISDKPHKRLLAPDSFFRCRFLTEFNLGHDEGESFTR